MIPRQTSSADRLTASSRAHVRGQRSADQVPRARLRGDVAPSRTGVRRGRRSGQQTTSMTFRTPTGMRPRGRPRRRSARAVRVKDRVSAGSDGEQRSQSTPMAGVFGERARPCLWLEVKNALQRPARSLVRATAGANFFDVEIPEGVVLELPSRGFAPAVARTSDRARR